MSNITTDKVVETRLKEIYECTQSNGWKHIENMISSKILELKNLESIASYPDEDKLKMITIHIEVAQRLQEVLNQINVEVDSHTTEKVDEIRVYGADDFGE
jgi:hypothetical protein